MTNLSSNTSWHSVRWGRVVRIILFILACILVPIIFAYGMSAALIYGLVYLLFSPTELPILLFYTVFVILALISTLYLSRRAHWRTKLVRTLGVLFVAIIFSILTSGMALYIYQQYRIVQTTPKMEVYLETRYDQDFVVIEPESCTIRSSSKFGGPYSRAYVCARAYSKSNPAHVFVIKEDYNHDFFDEFRNQFR